MYGIACCFSEAALGEFSASSAQDPAAARLIFIVVADYVGVIGQVLLSLIRQQLLLGIIHNNELITVWSFALGQV